MEYSMKASDANVVPRIDDIMDESCCDEIMHPSDDVVSPSNDDSVPASKCNLSEDSGLGSPGSCEEDLHPPVRKQRPVRQCRKYDLRESSVINRIQTERRRKQPRQPKPKVRPPPLSKYRRKSANSRERMRMKDINEAFDVLRHVVPPLPASARLAPGTKIPTKITTLRLAMNYIRALRDMLGYEPIIMPDVLPNLANHSEEYEDHLHLVMVDSSLDITSKSDKVYDAGIQKESTTRMTSNNAFHSAVSNTGNATLDIMMPSTCQLISGVSETRPNHIPPAISRDGLMTTVENQMIPHDGLEEQGKYSPNIAYSIDSPNQEVKRCVGNEIVMLITNHSDIIPGLGFNHPYTETAQIDNFSTPDRLPPCGELMKQLQMSHKFQTHCSSFADQFTEQPLPAIRHNMVESHLA